MNPLLSALAGDAEIEQLLSEEAQLASMLVVEDALAQASADLGWIGQDAAAAIAAGIAGFTPDWAGLRAGMAQDGVVVPVLVRQLRAATEWDEGWNYRGMGQFGRSVSPLDEIILLLALARVGEAKGAVLEKIGQLGPDPALSHIRAIAVYCETFPDAEFAAALERLLESPGISHHAWTMIEEELADIPESTTDNTTRNRSLRELYLLRALWRCGDPRGVAAPRLARYTSDIRGHFARHARRILDEPRGRRPRNSTHGALNS